MSFMKKTLRKAAVIGAGAVLVGMTLSGALAMDLGDYPTPFTGDDTVLVVGSAAGTEDNAAQEDVAFGLGGDTPAVVVTGDELTFEDGELEEFQVGLDFTDSTAFGAGLDDSDEVGLTEGELNVNIGTNTDYDYHEEIAFTSDAVATTALVQADDDFGPGVFLVFESESMNYSYVVEDSMAVGNRFNDSDSSNEIELSFLGRQLDIQGAPTATSITAVVGDQLQLNAGESVKVDGHTVKFERTGATTGSFLIDGEIKTGEAGATLVRPGVEVYIDALFDEDDPAQEMAIITVGKDALKTFSSGTYYWDEDKTHYLWEWSLAGLTSGSPTLGVSLNVNLDDPTEKLHADIVDLGLISSENSYLSVGEYLCLPHRYACVVFDSITGDMEPENVKFSLQQEKKDTVDGANAEVLNDAYGLLITSSVGVDKGLIVGSEKTDSAFVHFNATTGNFTVWQYEEDNGNYELTTAGAGVGNNSTGDIEILQLDNGQFNSVVYADLGAGAAGTATFKFTIAGDDGSNISFNGTTDGTYGLYKIGSQVGRDTTSHVFYGTTALDDYEHDVTTPDGVLIYNPESNVDDDQLSIAIPDDDEFKVKVRVAMPTGVASGDSSSDYFSKMKDTEVMDSLADYNLISIGGPAVNKVSAHFLGVDFPAYGADSGIAEDKAILELKANGDNWALVVAGWEKDNTLAAASVLKNYGEYTLAGKTAVVVSGIGATNLVVA